MAAVHILTFGAMVGFRIVPFIATHVKMKKKKKKKNSVSCGKKKSVNQNSPICMKTTDMNLFKE